MYQAITTKYIGPTNVKGSRVKATAAAGSVTLHWDDSLNPDNNHTAAALALANKFGWSGRWHGGGNPDGRGNVYVVETGDNQDGFICLPITTKEETINQKIRVLAARARSWG